MDSPASSSSSSSSSVPLKHDLMGLHVTMHVPFPFSSFFSCVFDLIIHDSQISGESKPHRSSTGALDRMLSISDLLFGFRWPKYACVLHSSHTDFLGNLCEGVAFWTRRSNCVSPVHSEQGRQAGNGLLFHFFTAATSSNTSQCSSPESQGPRPNGISIAFQAQRRSTVDPGRLPSD